jgi:hypothetical protein
LEIELDDSNTRRIGAAGGGVFTVMPSQKPVAFTIRAPRGYRPITWKGIPFFTADQGIVLLGYGGALENFDITFHGPDRTFSILPRF